MKKGLFGIFLLLSVSNADLVFSPQVVLNYVFNNESQTDESKKPPSYMCGIFLSALNSQTLIENNSNIKICGTSSISSKNDSTDIQCSIESQCSVYDNCKIIKSPLNKYTADLYHSLKTVSIPTGDDITLTNTDYKDYSGEQNINFEAQTTYSDSDKKFMTLGTFKLSGDNKTYTFEPGDYFFDNLLINGNNTSIKINNNGPVRIFVAGDLNISDVNININNSDDSNASNNLFIYTGNNFNYNNTVDTGNSVIKGYLYVKGNVNITSKNNINWYGAITAEGNINIEGDNKNFYYVIPNSHLAYDKCALCYADRTKAHWFRIMNMLQMTFKFRVKSAIINQSQNTLENVNVKMVEIDPSWFNASTPQMYRLSDENDSTVFKYMENNTTYAYSNGLGFGIKASVHNSGYGIVFSPPRGDIQPPVTENNISTISVTSADFGEYNPTGFEHYNAFETTFGIDTTIIGENLRTFYANYYDNEGRYYKNVQLDYCMNIPQNESDPYTDIAGIFDAWDIDENINTRNIKTKIVSKEFKLKISGIENNQEKAFEKGTVQYALFDILGNKEITPFYDFNTTNASIEHEFNITKSFRDVKVEFKICADVDEDGNLLLKNSSECNNAPEYSCKESPGNIGWRKCFSTDDFAIRPYKFVIENVPTKAKAAEEYNITIKALDYTGAPAKDYNETISLQSSPKFFYKDNNPNANRIITIESNRTFANGVVKLTFKYPEVGNGKLFIEEINGSEYAIVDNDDTNDMLRYIEKDDNNITFVPYRFKIDGKYTNYNDGNFTYISNDLNMSSNLKINIIALNKDNNITQYYTSNMYAKDIDINITHSVLNNGIVNILYKENNQSGIVNSNIINPIQINISKSYFTSSNPGVAEVNLKINFPKNYRKPIDMFIFSVNTITLSDGDANGTNNLNQTANFYYGRVFFNNIVTPETIANNKAVYKVWKNDGWVENKNHTSELYGEINSFYVTVPKVNTAIENVNNAIQKFIVTTTHSLPYKVKLHVSIPSWLWYHPLALDYQEPSNNNLDCLTHPCTSVTFQDDSKGWGGVGNNDKKYSEENRTSNIKNTKSIYIDKKSVNKINW